MKRAVLSAALLLPGFAALAQTPGIQGVVDALKAQGYSGIEVSAPHGGKITVEAYRQGAERELVYDARTGRVLADQSHSTSHATDDGHADSGRTADDDHGASGGDSHGDDSHGGGSGSSGSHGGDHGGGDDSGHGGGGGGNDSGDDHGGGY